MTRAWTLTVLALAACSKKDAEPAPAPTPIVTAAAKAEPAPAHATGEVVFDVPASWTKEEAPRPMRKATYRVAPDAELAVSEAGGPPGSNIKRWEGQFGGGASTVEERTPGGLKVSVVSIAGPYTGMGDPTPKAGYALLGAIVLPADPSGTSTFLKLVGPKAAVDAARPDFDRLVASLRRK